MLDKGKYYKERKEKKTKQNPKTAKLLSLKKKNKTNPKPKQKPYNDRCVIFHCTIRHNQKNPYETGHLFIHKIEFIPSPHDVTGHMGAKGQVPKSTECLCC